VAGRRALPRAPPPRIGVYLIRDPKYTCPLKIKDVHPWLDRFIPGILNLALNEIGSGEGGRSAILICEHLTQIQPKRHRCYYCMVLELP